MNVYLAATNASPKLEQQFTAGKYYLESFYYFRPWQTVLINKNFMLDSGAFTFMASSKNHNINWDMYVVKYANFIRKHNIKLFFELDIDVLVGIKEVERLRAKLERLTGKKCIPVWHKSRGKEYFLKMVKHYDYVAIGGIVTKEIKKKEYKYFKWFIDMAHKHNCKIHGLGFTPMNHLHKYNFDSVDSSSWNSAGRFGTVYKFNGKKLVSHKIRGKRLADRPRTDAHNLNEWLKFQRYAEKAL